MIAGIPGAAPSELSYGTPRVRIEADEKACDGGRDRRHASRTHARFDFYRLSELSFRPGANKHVHDAIELLKQCGFDPTPDPGPQAATVWFRGLDDRRKLTALHRLVGETLVREGPAAKKVALVLRQVGVGYAHGKFVPHGKKLEEYETVFHTYTQGSKLGQGGTGTVFEVTDEGGKPWALKVLSEANPTTTRRNRFANELWFCAHHSHPNWLPVRDWGLTTVEGRPFYVMPRYQGNLRDRLRTGIADEKILTYFRQMLDGIEAAHANKVWHRDLKPENVLYDAERDALVVADFGIAHFRSDILRAGVQTRKSDRLANSRLRRARATSQSDNGRWAGGYLCARVDPQRDVHGRDTARHRLQAYRGRRP